LHNNQLHPRLAGPPQTGPPASVLERSGIIEATSRASACVHAPSNRQQRDAPLRDRERGRGVIETNVSISSWSKKRCGNGSAAVILTL